MNNYLKTQFQESNLLFKKPSSVPSVESSSKSKEKAKGKSEAEVKKNVKEEEKKLSKKTSSVLTGVPDFLNPLDNLPALKGTQKGERTKAKPYNETDQAIMDEFDKAWAFIQSEYPPGTFNNQAVENYLRYKKGNAIEMGILNVYIDKTTKKPVSELWDMSDTISTKKKRSEQVKAIQGLVDQYLLKEIFGNTDKYFIKREPWTARMVQKYPFLVDMPYVPDWMNPLIDDKEALINEILDTPTILPELQYMEKWITKAFDDGKRWTWMPKDVNNPIHPKGKWVPEPLVKYWIYERQEEIIRKNILSIVRTVKSQHGKGHVENNLLKEYELLTRNLDTTLKAKDKYARICEKHSII